MGIRLNSNVTSINIIRYLNSSNAQLNKSLERLASGFKINRASDNAAGLLVSENLRSQIRGFDMATSNAQQGLSMLQTADGAMQQITESLQKIREIAVAASNGTTSTAQFSAYQAEVQAQLETINNIASSTKYSGHVLLDGSVGATFSLQIGPNSGDTLNIATAFTDNQWDSGLGITQNTLTSNADATALMGEIDTALGKVTTNLSKIGQFENAVTNQMDYLSIAKENTSAAESSIRNTDVAWETANVARLQILQQAGAYALAQSNMMPSLLTRLLS